LVAAWGEKAATLQVGKTAVNALGFGQNPLRGDGSIAKLGLARWLLGVGQAGGNVSIWDLETLTVRSFCYGSNWDVHTVAFSPDGMTLASAGRNETRLWDVFTGQLLFKLAVRIYTTALAFSPDGKRLAVSSYHQFGFNHLGGVDVWEILPGRGVQSLRGLLGQIDRVVWSPDGRRIAAIAKNWQVGVWDREANKLLHVFEPPPGPFADHVGLAFSPDGTRLAWSAHRTALLWDLDTGRQVRSWRLPTGFQDELLYAGPKELHLFRVETDNPDVGPFMADARKRPRLCRIRNLLDEGAKAITSEEFSRGGVFVRAASPSGGCFVVEGFNVVGMEKPRSIKAFDAKTGAARWTIPSRRTADGSSISLDPNGDFATVYLAEGEPGRVIEVSTGRLRMDLDGGGLGPKAALRLAGSKEFSIGPRVTIGLPHFDCRDSLKDLE
jgi:WD40 repeat protein